MDGSIGFSTEAGQGSSFWIELPIETADTVSPNRYVPSVPLSTPAHGGYTMLYVEDNPANLRLVEHVVRALPDVTLLTAPRAQLGLDLARAHRPHVIILDINLPEMSGFELLARLKAMPETREIPVVALSAAAMPKDIKRGLAAGFFSYMTKPLDVSEFQRNIEAALKYRPPPPVAAIGT